MSADLSLLLPYQKLGIAFLARNPNVILGDDTGLGKSVQCILAAEALRYARILILCPPIGIVAWRTEQAKWQRNPRRFHVFNKTDIGIPNGMLVYIVPYSALSVKPLREKVLRQVQAAEPFDVVIIDEAHYLGNVASQRTSAVYGRWSGYEGGIVAYARPKSCWLLSGTIQKRDARDLYPHLKAIFPEAINIAMQRPLGAKVIKRDYDDRFLLFADNGFGLTPSGNNPHTLPFLRTAMKPFVLARRKRDVAPELGAVRQFDLPLGIDPDDPYADQAQHPEFGKALIEDLMKAQSLHTALILSKTAAEERRILGMIKVRPVCAWIEDWFENAADTDKLVVFAWHRDVIREIEERTAAYRPVVVMGGATDAQRQLAVEMFQTDPKTRLFIGQTIACGVSITLTASSTVLTMEPDWIPSNDYQAVSRVHRLGQTEPVFNYRAFVSGTVDSRIHSKANQRLREFEQLMDGLVTGGTN